MIVVCGHRARQCCANVSETVKAPYDDVRVEPAVKRRGFRSHGLVHKLASASLAARGLVRANASDNTGRRHAWTSWPTQMSVQTNPLPGKHFIRGDCDACEYRFPAVVI